MNNILLKFFRLPFPDDSYDVDKSGLMFAGILKELIEKAYDNPKYVSVWVSCELDELGAYTPTYLSVYRADISDYPEELLNLFTKVVLRQTRVLLANPDKWLVKD